MKFKIFTGIIRFTLLTTLITSCNQFREVSCSEAAEGYRADTLNIVIRKTSNSAYKLKLEGYDPAEKKPAIFKQQNYTWAQWFIAKISVGDTVVKKKGELKFYIHKKEEVLIFPFECNGNIYE